MYRLSVVFVYGWVHACMCVGIVALDNISIYSINSQYQSITDNTIITILNSQYIDYQHFSRASAVSSICSTRTARLI